MITGTYSYKNIWRVAYPILISLVMEQLIGLTDTAFMGRVGEVELGASAIAIIYYIVLFMIGFGFSIGAQIIIGRRNGEGRFQETGKVFWNGLYFVLGLSGVLILLSELFSPWMMRKLVSSEAIYGAALSYVRWRLPGMVFAFITAMFRAFYVGTTQTKTLTLNSIVMVASNVIFNWIIPISHLDLIDKYAKYLFTNLIPFLIILFDRFRELVMYSLAENKDTLFVKLCAYF